MVYSSQDVTAGSLKGALGVLDPYVGRLACTVSRGAGAGDGRQGTRRPAEALGDTGR